MSDMDTNKLRLMDELAAAATAGDPQVVAVIPTFGQWFGELLRDPIARSLEPGSVGHTARMFALQREARDAS